MSSEKGSRRTKTKKRRKITADLYHGIMSQQSEHIPAPLANGGAAHEDTGTGTGNTPAQYQQSWWSAYVDRPPNKKQRASDNTVISIFRKNRLIQVVLGDDVPFLCALCGLAFTHTTPMREHARLCHFYVEPSIVSCDEQGPQIMMKRIFKPPERNESAPVQSEVEGERATHSDIHVQTEPPEGETDKQGNSDAESDTSGGGENSSQSVPPEDTLSASTPGDGGSAGCLENGGDSTSDNGYLGEKAESEEFKSFKNDTSITVRVPRSSLDDKYHSQLNHSGNTKKRKRPSRRCHPCHLCGKPFPVKSKRSTHLREVHRVFKTEEKAVEFQQKMQELSTGSEAGGKGTQVIGPLKCPYCLMYFSFESSLARHLQSHCGTFGVKCDICKEGIQLWNEGKNQEMVGLLKKYKAELAEHTRREGQELPAELQSDSLPKAVEKPAAAVGNAGGEASNGSKSMEMETRVQEILRLSVVKAGRLDGSACIIDCFECGERFYLRHHLINHYKTHAIFHCKSCPEAFGTMAALSDHCLNIHKEGCFKCFFCPRRFFSTGKATYHMLGHLGLYQCICCGLACMTKQSLERHIEIYSLEEDHSEPPDATVSIQYSSLNPFTVQRGRQKRAPHCSSKARQHLQRFRCKYCPRKFSRVGVMTKHVLFAHPSEASPEDVNNSVICDQCGEVFLSILHLKKHQEIHKEKTIPCTEVGCFAKFKSYRGLHRHLQQHKTFKPTGCQTTGCSKCGKRFRTERNLRRHMLLHEGKNPNQCRFCDKIMLNTTRLWYHEQQVHTDEKNHECPHCKKRYACPSTLKEHLLTHSEEKPFVCEHCGAPFNTIWGLRAHLRIHTKPFKCEQCGEGFAQKGGRRNHLRRAHGVDEPMTRKYKGCSWSKVEESQQETEHTGSLQDPVVILENSRTGESNTTLGHYPDEATSMACEPIMSKLVEQCNAQQL